MTRITSCATYLPGEIVEDDFASGPVSHTQTRVRLESRGAQAVFVLYHDQTMTLLTRVDGERDAIYLDPNDTRELLAQMSNAWRRA